MRWEWEVRIPELDNVSVFIIPGTWVKNSDDRLVVLNQQAREIIEEVRGTDPDLRLHLPGKTSSTDMLNSPHGKKHGDVQAYPGKNS